MKDLQAERARALGLLDGTTPGEWSYQHGWGIQVWSQKGVGLLIYAEAGTLANVKDQGLMAAAPTLARDYAAALGEVERLREALEEIADEYDTDNAASLRSMAREAIGPQPFRTP